jgi:hypothetical protein
VTGVWLVLGALLAAAVASELALRGTKLQTGLGRVLIAWAAVYLAVLYPMFAYGDTGPVPFTIFWGGAFLSWFGVRSHIESSILLRMLYLLRQKSLGESELLAAYTAQYGPDMRIQELLRGKMATRQGEGLSVTPKGKGILRVVALLR